MSYGVQGWFRSGGARVPAGRGRAPRRSGRQLALLTAAAVLAGLPAARAVAPPSAEDLTSRALAALESPKPTPPKVDDPKVDVTAPGAAGRPARAPFDPAKATVVETTEDVRTYRNPDGSTTQRIAAGQKWFRDTLGAWQEIDLTLVEAGDGRLQPKASSMGLRLGLRGSDSLAEVPIDALNAVRFSLDGMREDADGRRKPNRSGDAAEFDGAGPGGVDVRVQPLTRGFETSYTYAGVDQVGEPMQERFAVPLGWRGRQAGSAVELVNAVGDVVARWGSGEAFDSARNVSRVPVVSRLVENNPGEVVVREEVDTAWLTDPERVFPLVIDPIFSTGEPWAGDWTAVASDATRNGDLDTSLRVGDWGIDAAQNRVLFRSLLQFAPNNFNQGNAGVVAADLTLKYKEATANCATKTMLVRRNVAAMTDKTWNGMPPSSEADQVVWSDGCSSSDRVLDLWWFADVWTKENGQNWGVSLVAANESLYDSGRGFRSYDDGAAPTLDVTFEQIPGRVTATGPSDKSVLMTTRPTLSVTTATPDTDNPQSPTYYFYRLSTSPDAESGERTDSGWLQGATSWQLPEGYLRDGLTYYWHVFTWDGDYDWVIQAPSPVQSFRVDARRGAGGPSPTDDVGPVTVNLASGNLSFKTSTPSFATVGGAQSFTAAYNSQESTDFGLSGAYYNDHNQDGVFNDPIAFRRTDTNMDMNWGTTPPSMNVTPDYFLSRWEGFFTAPETGWFNFGAVHDDGVKLYYGPDMSSPKLDEWCCYVPLGEIHWAPTIFLNKGQSTPLKVDYREVSGPAYMQLYVNGPTLSSVIVPASLLSTTTRTLPTGWSFSTDLDGDLSYASARVSSNAVTVYAPDGSTTPFSSDGKGGWKGPADQDAILTQEPDGTLSLFDDDGRNYRFDASGNLASVASTVDVKNPAAPEYTYGTVQQAAQPRLIQVRDSVSNRTTSLRWGLDSACTSRSAPAANLVADAPLGMLCAILYWDGTRTDYWYNANGQLARIDDPGVNAANPQTTSFGYDGGGRVDRIRDARAADFVAAGKRLDDDSILTRMVYQRNPGNPYRVLSVQLPDPEVGALPVKHNYNYLSGVSQTHVDIDGFSPPSGHARVVTFDAGGRLTADTDGAGLTATKTWRSTTEDLPLSSVGPDGMQTTTLYDHANRPTDTWGPALSAFFNGDGTPNAAYTAQIPHSVTRYDEGYKSLNVAYWANQSLAGSPKAVELGVGQADGRIERDYIASPPPLSGLTNGTDGFSARATGEIRLRENGVYTFRVHSDDGVRLFVDDTTVVSDWTPHAPAYAQGLFINSGGDSWHRIRLEYFNNNQGASLRLEYTTPSGGQLVVPGSDLRPRYGLTTSQTDPDGTVTATEYAQPQFGQATATVQNPGGLAIRSQTAHEPLGTGFFRVDYTTMPKGGVTDSDYYGNTETALDPCPSALGSINQGGALKRTADPVGSSPSIVREFRYDQRGRVIASRVVGDANWSCTVYDGRGRPTTQTDSQGATTLNVYADPSKVVTQYTDWGSTARQTTAESNLLGWATKYTDEHGTVTRTVHDQMGRVTATHRALFGGAESQFTATAYLSNGRVQSTSEYASGAARTTTYGYDAAGRPSTTTLPNGITTTTGYDASRGTVTALTHANASGALSNWAYARSLSGNVTSETGAGRVRGFNYDAAGRLTQATEGPFTRRYAYDANTNRCANAANCASPTFTYDAADRILASPYASSYTYDAHGNTTSVNYSGAQPSGAINDTAAFDTSASAAPRTFPVVVGRSGAINASTDWSASQPALRTGSWSPSIVGGASPSTPMTVYGQSELGSSVSWPQATGTEPISDAATVTTAAPRTTAVTPNLSGTLAASVAWPVVNKPYSLTGPTLSSASPTWQQNIVVSGQGNIKLDVAWNFVAFNHPNLKLELFEGATLRASSNTSSYIDPSEHINWTMTPSLAYPGTRTYTVKVTRLSGASTAFTVQNSSFYPVTPNVGFELRRTSDNALIQSSTQGSGTPSRSLTAAVVGGTAYSLNTTTADEAASVTVSGSRPNQAYPNLRLALLNAAGQEQSSVSGAAGSLSFPAWFSTAAQGGGWSWKITNNSGPAYTATPTLNWSATTRGVDVDAGGLAAGQMIEKNLVPDANGTLDTSLAWSTEPGGSTPNVTLALKDAGGAVLSSVSGAAGTLSLPSYALTGATTYKIAVTNNAAFALRSFTRAATLPAQGSQKLELVDVDGVVKLVGTGRKPQTIAGKVAPGAYTLRVTPISGAGSGSTTASFPGRVPAETTTFDGRDHAITIDDGTTKVSDYLSPSGRVIRHVVAPSGGGTPSEDTLFGYDDGGDTPAYSRPAAGGPVTTYLDGAIDVAGTVTYQHSNLHGDIIGTSTAAGAFAHVTPADEYGLQEAASTSRLGWLGKQRRFEVGVNNLIRMGVRLYDPRTGRFLQVDPIEGGTSNDYAYVDDPVNDFDLTGEWGFKKFFKRALKNRFARMAVAGLGAAAFCAGTGGLGCMILAGGAVGAGLGAGNAALNGGSLLRGAGTGAVEGAIAGLIVGSGQGKELKFSRNFRIAPGGNRGPGRFQKPHYHRRYPGPGGSIDWHRPWQKGW